MLLMFKKTLRGLAAMNQDGKMFFPDWTSTINAEGLYECTISKDKDKYAFVRGELVKTKKPRGNEYYAFTQAFDRLDADREFKILKLGESIIFYACSHGVSGFYHYTVENGIMNTTMILSYDNSYPYDHNKSSFYQLSVFTDELRNMDISFFNDMIDTIDDSMLMKAVCYAYTLVYHKSFLNRDINCAVYGNKFIMVSATFSDPVFHHSIQEPIVWIYGKIGNSLKPIDVSSSTNKDILKLPKVEISESSIIDFMMTNHYIGHVSNDILVTNRRYFRDDAIDLTGIAINHAMMDGASEKDKGIARKSFEEYASYRKRIGKYISKDMYKEFAKLSPKNMLFS